MLGPEALSPASKTEYTRAGHGATRHLLPSMQEQREPDPVELVRDLRVEERQEPTHLVQTVHLGRRHRVISSALGGKPSLRLLNGKDPSGPRSP